MTWVEIRHDKRALYNLDQFEAIGIFEREDGKGWIVSGIRNGNPAATLVEAPTLEAAERILQAVAGRVGAMDLGVEKPQ
jgi:hypothetical protein